MQPDAVQAKKKPLECRVILPCARWRVQHLGVETQHEMPQLQQRESHRREGLLRLQGSPAHRHNSSYPDQQDSSHLSGAGSHGNMHHCVTYVVFSSRQAPAENSLLDMAYCHSGPGYVGPGPWLNRPHTHRHKRWQTGRQRICCDRHSHTDGYLPCGDVDARTHQNQERRIQNGLRNKSVGNGQGNVDLRQ